MLQGNVYMNVEYKYRTNVDVASMLLAWSLELGWNKDIKNFIKTYVCGEQCWGLNSFIP